MKVFVLLAILAIANGAVSPLWNNKHLIPRMPRLPTLDGAQPDVSPIEPYIVGGTEAQAHSWPWQVHLDIDNKYFCGGSLISNTCVMTAAHCTTGSAKIVVTLGDHNRSRSEGTEVTRTSSQIITHPNYNANHISDDIGLVVIPSVAYTSAIKAATLPPANTNLAAGVELTPTGWGLTSDATLAALSDVLRQVNVPSISNSECAGVYGSLAVPDSKICTSGAGGKGTCSGDSGGPLNHPVGTGYEVRGIVSYGASAGCTKGYPDAFTRVSYYIDWIKANC